MLTEQQIRARLLQVVQDKNKALLSLPGLFRKFANGSVPYAEAVAAKVQHERESLSVMWFNSWMNALAEVLELSPAEFAAYAKLPESLQEEDKPEPPMTHDDEAPATLSECQEP